MNRYQRHLIELKSDEAYRKLQLSTVPGQDERFVIGVRTPDVRQYAKELIKSGESDGFINKLPHEYYEEYLLHALILSLYKDFDKLIPELECFLPYIDNWAVCDQLNPKILSKHKDELLIKIRAWIKSDHDYTVRFAMRMLMNHFLGDDLKEEYLDLVNKADNGSYYVSMMSAWYFATALAKNYDETLEYISAEKLPVWTHNKAIQKAIESYRISDSQKEHLRTLKRKIR